MSVENHYSFAHFLSLLAGLLSLFTMFPVSLSLMSVLASVGLATPQPHLYGYGYPGLYSAPSTNMALMEGKFVSKKIHPNQEAIIKMYNGVWGAEDEGDDAG